MILAQGFTDLSVRLQMLVFRYKHSNPKCLFLTFYSRLQELLPDIYLPYPFNQSNTQAGQSSSSIKLHYFAYP